MHKLKNSEMFFFKMQSKKELRYQEKNPKSLRYKLNLRVRRVLKIIAMLIFITAVTNININLKSKNPKPVI